MNFNRAGSLFQTMVAGHFRQDVPLIDHVKRSAQRRLIKRQFRQHLGYEGNFENPVTYAEKVQFRKLYGNHVFYAEVADKYRSRDYVSRRIGPQYLKPVLGVYDRLTPQLLESFPKPFIVKANNGCKWHRIVRTPMDAAWSEIVRYFDKLSYRRYSSSTGERHYDFIPFKIVVESLLLDAEGQLPWDYDLWCFNTPEGFRYIPSVISPDGKKASFDAQWNLLQGDLTEAQMAERANPPRFDELVALARVLSAEFDFVRIDFNIVNGNIYFGEITCTPGQGYTVISHPKRLQLLTDWWHLDGRNPQLYIAPKAYAAA